MTEQNDCKKCEEIKECSYYDKHCDSTPKPVVSIPEDAYESRLGRLFVGRTDFLTFDHNSYAWGD